MSTDRSYVDENARTLERMRALVERLDDASLARPIYDDWTVAGTLAHVAFWDARIRFLLRKLQRGEAFTDDDVEPDDVSWINDSARPLLHAIAPRAAADVAVAIAEETDALVAAAPPDRLYPVDPSGLINAFRSNHRDEHLDEIEALFRAGDAAP
jgi:hypothetical protein